MQGTATQTKMALPLSFQALRPAEWMLLGIIGLVGVGSAVLALGLGRIVDWAGFAPGIAAALGMVALGGYARSAKNAPRLGASAIGIGTFMGFTAFASIFIFALFPLQNPLIDARLVAADAALGYDWAGFVEALANWPRLGTALGYLYHSSLPQMIGVIILLGLLGRETDLHRFLLVGMLCMTVTVGFWWLWPSIGPSATAELPREIAARIGLVVTPEIGAHLRQLVETGPDVIRPDAVMGVVGFPSYHMIMALMVAYFARRTVLFWPLALAGVGMVPATLSHGGHHLVDLLAATVVFAVVVMVARRLLPEPAAG